METKKKDLKVNDKAETLNNPRQEKVIKASAPKDDGQSFISFLLEHYRQSNGTHIC